MVPISYFLDFVIFAEKFCNKSNSEFIIPFKQILFSFAVMKKQHQTSINNIDRHFFFIVLDKKICTFNKISRFLINFRLIKQLSPWHSPFTVCLSHLCLFLEQQQKFPKLDVTKDLSRMSFGKETVIQEHCYLSPVLEHAHHIQNPQWTTQGQSNVFVNAVEKVVVAKKL